MKENKTFTIKFEYNDQSYLATVTLIYSYIGLPLEYQVYNIIPNIPVIVDPVRFKGVNLDHKTESQEQANALQAVRQSIIKHISAGLIQ